MTFSPELHPLLPTIIAKGTPQHKAVEALATALENNDIHNIAITGNYGSGKSSVIETYINENKKKKHNDTNEKGNLKWCRISLATIEALSDYDNNQEKGDGNGKEDNNSYQLKERKDSTYAHYIEYYWKEFEPEIKGDALTVDVVLYLLNSISLTAIDKEALMEAIPLQMPANNSEVATVMSDCLSLRFTFLDYPTLYSIIQNSVSDNGRMSVTISTIHHCLDNDKNEEVIKNVIHSLGGHYLELLEDKRPTLKTPKPTARYLIY